MTMLKSLGPKINLFNAQITKCAEIFCRSESSFYIVCTSCDMKSFELTDFIAHFKNAHWAITNETEVADTNLNVCEIEELNHHISSCAKDDTNGKDDIWESNTLNKTLSEETSQSCKSEPVSVHEEDNEGIKVLCKKPKRREWLVCQKCYKQFKNNSTLKQHQQRYCNKNPGTASPEFSCIRCTSVFQKSKDLKDHCIQEHGGFPCEQCNNVYKTKRNLDIHRVSHSEERAFHCIHENCNKRFKVEQDLIRHKRHIHAGVRKFVCEVCGYRTYSATALTVHVRTHTGEKPFECSTCGKRFISSKSLAEHKPTHSTEKPHVCDVCGKAFTLRKSLYHHKHLHLDFKKFVCKICGSAFAQASALSAHTKKHKMENFHPTILKS